MSDRPERPPVWVRGGPPYYYMPARQNIASGSDVLRRASTSSIPSASPTAATEEPASPPSSPVGSAQANTGSFAQTSPFSAPQNIGQTEPQPQMQGPFPSMQSQSPPGSYSMMNRRRSSGSNNERRGSSLFANLSTQKRDSIDPDVAARKMSWFEQRSMSERNPFSAWWDNYTKGNSHSPTRK